MAQVVLQSPKGSALRAFSKLQLLARLLWVKLGGDFVPLFFFFSRGEKRGGIGYRLLSWGGGRWMNSTEYHNMAVIFPWWFVWWGHWSTHFLFGGESNLMQMLIEIWDGFSCHLNMAVFELVISGSLYTLTWKCWDPPFFGSESWWKKRKFFIGKKGVVQVHEPGTLLKKRRSAPTTFS